MAVKPLHKPLSSRDLQQWLFNKALGASAGTSRRMIAGNDQRKRDTTIMGKLYFFRYDPKGKYTLSKYDKFPMVFPIEPYTDGFLGLNLHYLDYGYRHVLVDRLMDYKSDTKMDQHTKIRMTYQLLNSTKKLNTISRPCIKRYLFNHVRSKFIEVWPEEYHIAIQLPVADWVFNV